MYTEQEWSELLTKQTEMEEQGLSMGCSRFRRRLEQAQTTGQASQQGAARKLVSQALDPLTAYLDAWVEASATTRGRKHLALRWVKAVGTDVAAYITLRCVFDSMTERTSARKVALKVSEILIDELRYRRFKEQAPGLFEYKLTSFNTSSYAHMARSLDASIRYAEIDMSDLQMAQATSLLVGTKLLDCLSEATGLIKLESERVNTGTRSRTETFLSPTVETKKWMQQRNAVLEWLTPVHLPMAVPPLPWGPHDQRGGYRFALRGKYPVVRGVSKAQRATIDAADMPQVYGALNRIQETAWRINSRVYEAVKAIANRGGGWGGVPAMEGEPLPAKPADIDTNEQARKVWRRAAYKVREANHTRAMMALDFSRVLTVVEQVKDLSAFYFPYNLDFRGRVYPICNYLSPQGDDMSRGLLQFAEGKPLGSEGKRWLALHGATCLGQTPGGEKVSTMTMDERVSMIEGLSVGIMEVASDPQRYAWWTDAEEPVQFLAFCFEWDAMLRSGRGERYVSSLPCGMDGTCNGLQHFAALLRDPVGAKAVNVTPSDRPQDVYQRVADTVLDIMQRSDDNLALLWLTSGLVDRKLCKRPTMTFGYGSKRFGFQSQILEYLKAHEDAKHIREHFTATDEEGNVKSLLRPACSFMSELIWQSLRQIVVAAFGGMEWMQKASRVVAKDGQPVCWTVGATGFPVRQEYFESTKRQVRTILAGKMYFPSVYTTTEAINATKQANAIAPNFIHSLDAAALMLMVHQAAAEGIESFAVIHDSYGTLAADCALLAKVTRQSFLRLYSADVIGKLHAELQAQATEDIPSPPPQGTLDLGLVLASEYFFA